MRILATDLDRTLLPNGSWPPDPGAIDLFNELTEKHDVLVVYVTCAWRIVIQAAEGSWKSPWQ